MIKIALEFSSRLVGMPAALSVLPLAATKFAYAEEVKCLFQAQTNMVIEVADLFYLSPGSYVIQVKVYNRSKQLIATEIKTIEINELTLDLEIGTLSSIYAPMRIN